MRTLRTLTAAIVVLLATVLFPAAASGGTIPSAGAQLGCQDALVTTFGTGQYAVRLTATTRFGKVSTTTIAQGSSRVFLDLNGLPSGVVTGVELQVLSGGVVVLDRRTVAC